MLVDDEPKTAETMGPFRTSLPSMLPPGEVAEIDWLSLGLAEVDVAVGLEGRHQLRRRSAHRANMAPTTAMPCLRSLAILPKVHPRANGMESRTQLGQAVGQAGRVLEGVGGVRVEVATAVGSHLLDGLLGGRGTAGAGPGADR